MTLNLTIPNFGRSALVILILLSTLVMFRLLALRRLFCRIDFVRKRITSVFTNQREISFPNWTFQGCWVMPIFRLFSKSLVLVFFFFQDKAHSCLIEPYSFVGSCSWGWNLQRTQERAEERLSAWYWARNQLPKCVGSRFDRFDAEKTKAQHSLVGGWWEGKKKMSCLVFDTKFEAHDLCEVMLENGTW